MSTPSQPAGRPPVTREVSDRLVKAVLCVLVGVVVSVVALIILTPRRPPPPASPAQPDQAIIDRVGVVSPSYARTTAGALLNEPLAQILVYVDARPASGSIESYTTHAASTWNVGNERADNGLVLFVFPDVRIARVEVGYGLEGTLPDARVRQLLESALVPGLARGDYEVGLDNVSPFDRKCAQPPFGACVQHAVSAPVVANGKQIERLAAQRMEWMGDGENLRAVLVTICNARSTPKARSSGRSATFARTSSWPGPFAISKT